jgi:hypothetical protein
VDYYERFETAIAKTGLQLGSMFLYDRLKFTDYASLFGS